MTVTVLTVAWVAMVVLAGGRHRPVPAGRRPSTPPPKPLGPESHPRRRRSVERRMGRRRRRAAVVAAVPDLVDLFAVAIGAGLNVRLAVEAVARRAPAGAVTDELRRVAEAAAAGARLADALEQVPSRLGVDDIRPLVAALVDAERYGSALGPSLDRLAEESRRCRQRRAEEVARRVPVKLLFPLVTCVLPAFGLLTVAPLIAGGLRALRL